MFALCFRIFGMMNQMHVWKDRRYPDTHAEDFLRKKIDEWKNDINELSAIAEREPQAAYSAFVYGTSKRWMFVARTTPNSSQLFRHLDWLISETFLPAIIGKEYITDTMMAIFSLQAKQGGLGITNIYILKLLQIPCVISVMRTNLFTILL